MSSCSVWPERSATGRRARLSGQLDQDYTELKTTLEQREHHFREQFASLEETKKSLSREFENIANKIFEEKGKTFTTTSKNSLDMMLKPFREQIEGFQKRINKCTTPPFAAMPI
jgi:DNA recombination protein RmuC